MCHSVTEDDVDVKGALKSAASGASATRSTFYESIHEGSVKVWAAERSPPNVPAV